MVASEINTAPQLLELNSFIDMSLVATNIIAQMKIQLSRVTSKTFKLS